MYVDKRKIQAVKNMILRGMVRHTDIRPRLSRAELTSVNPDDIAELSMNYKNRSDNIFSRFFNKIIFFINLILALAVSLGAGLVNSEFTASKVFSDTILAKKLTSFGDNLLYWFGLKKIDLSGTEMLSAIGSIIKATPVIIKSFFYGFIAGLFAYLIVTFLIKFIYRRKRMSNEIKKLIGRSSASGQNI
jgi:hypothetical protein